MKIQPLAKTINFRSLTPYMSINIAPYDRTINPDWEKIYHKSCYFHMANINGTQPERVEKYFEQQGVPATFKTGSEFAKKFVAYCCYHAAEMFKQLKHVLPSKIDMEDFEKFNIPDLDGANALTTDNQFFNYPIRTVIFNTFKKPNVVINKYTGEKIVHNWENFFNSQVYQHKIGFLSTPHFLSPFLHEFAHSFHEHNIFSKKGCHMQNAGYKYNPQTATLMQILRTPVDRLNLLIGPHINENIKRTISIYGGTNLNEAFAEGYTNNIINHMDLFKLRLTSYPFAPQNSDVNVVQAINEAFEGAVADNKGIV